MWNLVFLRDKWKAYGEPWLALYLTFRATSINKVEPSSPDQVNPPLLLCHDVSLSPSLKSLSFPLTQVHRYISAILIPIALTTCPLTGSSSSRELHRRWISASQRSCTCRETFSSIVSVILDATSSYGFVVKAAGGCYGVIVMLPHTDLLSAWTQP